MTVDTSKFAASSNIIFVLGGPGSGKGTQSAFLVQRFPELCHLSAGDLLREEVADKNSELGEEISHMIKNGLIVRAEVTVKLLQNAMAKNPEKKLFLIDGFPRAIAQAECFEKMVGTCKFVLLLDVPEDVMRDRLLERGKTSGRTDDNVESIIKRFRTYRETTMPVIELYHERVVTVRGDRTPEEVSAELESLFSQVIATE